MSILQDGGALQWPKVCIFEKNVALAGGSC